MLDLLSEKKKEEEEKKDKISDMMTKDSVKKDDEEKEEKPDTRGMYAKINLVKNKLRAAGQKDPLVMAVDACEENLGETIIRKDGSITHGAPKINKRGNIIGTDNISSKVKGGLKSQVGLKAQVGLKSKVDGLEYRSIPIKKKKGKKDTKYNPYGKGSNMNPTKASETTGP